MRFSWYLQAVAMLDKMLHLHFFEFFVFLDISHFYVPLGSDFPTLPNLLILFEYLTSYNGSKN